MSATHVPTIQQKSSSQVVTRERGRPHGCWRGSSGSWTWLYSRSSSIIL